MRIRFLRDEIYEAEGRNRGPRFTAGSDYDLRDDLAERWLRRGAAVVAPEPEPAPTHARTHRQSAKPGPVEIPAPTAEPVAPTVD